MGRLISISTPLYGFLIPCEKFSIQPWLLPSLIYPISRNLKDQHPVRFSNALLPHVFPLQGIPCFPFPCQPYVRSIANLIIAHPRAASCYSVINSTSRFSAYFRLHPAPCQSTLQDP